jgi:predicted RNA-binding protein with PUA-like domain
MAFWILKTEPSTYSFADLQKDKKTSWTGVRNYQARNNIRSMKVGDMAIIYHSGDEKAAVGIAKIIGAPYQELKNDSAWSAVDIQVVEPIKRPVTLSEIKADKVLKEIPLVRNSRLSVSPVSEAEYKAIVKKGSV